MKKIRRLSLHRKKKTQQSQENDSVETDEQSPKKQSSKSLLKRLSRGYSRTSVDENGKHPVLNGNITTEDGETEESFNFSASASQEADCEDAPKPGANGAESPDPDSQEQQTDEDEAGDYHRSVESPHTSREVVRLQRSNSCGLTNNVSTHNNLMVRERMPSPQLRCNGRVAYDAESNPLTEELRNLAKQGWYWGPLTKVEAEMKLEDTPDGSFLVRDSSDERYLLSVSFRSNGRTLHTRIQYSHGFSFYENFDYSSSSVVELINNSIRESQDSNVFCYMRSLEHPAVVTSVKLCYPVSRLAEVRSLQYLCRFVIRQFTRIDHIEILPLPTTVKGYLNQSYF